MDLSGFIGPTHFNVTRRLVDDVIYDESLTSTLAYSVTITQSTYRTFDTGAWGWNLGADGSYFFTKSMGVGGMFRYSRATIDLPNRLLSDTATDKVGVGGLFLGGGFRMRF